MKETILYTPVQSNKRATLGTVNYFFRLSVHFEHHFYYYTDLYDHYILIWSIKLNPEVISGKSNKMALTHARISFYLALFTHLVIVSLANKLQDGQICVLCNFAPNPFFIVFIQSKRFPSVIFCHTAAK